MVLPMATADGSPQAQLFFSNEEPRFRPVKRKAEFLDDGEDSGQEPFRTGPQPPARPGADIRIIGGVAVEVLRDSGRGTRDTLPLPSAIQTDPQRCEEYAQDIYGRLSQEEDMVYIEGEDAVDDVLQDWDHDDRQATVDFLISIQVQFILKTETLFLTINMFDRYVQQHRVKRSDLRLVGVSAMFIATKFEEIDPPDVRDFTHVHQCTKEDIFETEVSILNVLGFGLAKPTPMHFIDRFRHVSNDSEAHPHLVQYLLELALLDSHLARYTPSVQVAASSLAACRILQRRLLWNEEAVHLVQRFQLKVENCIEELLELHKAAPACLMETVQKKFAHQEKFCVSTLCRP